LIYAWEGLGERWSEDDYVVGGREDGWKGRGSDARYEFVGSICEGGEDEGRWDEVRRKDEGR